jgi:hypothetical protein
VPRMPLCRAALESRSVCFGATPECECQHGFHRDEFGCLCLYRVRYLSGAKRSLARCKPLTSSMHAGRRRVSKDLMDARWTKLGGTWHDARQHCNFSHHRRANALRSLAREPSAPDYSQILAHRSSFRPAPNHQAPSQGPRWMDQSDPDYITLPSISVPRAHSYRTFILFSYHL